MNLIRVLINVGLLLIAGVMAVNATSPCDEIRYRNAGDATARIDGCLMSLAQYPEAMGHLIVYGSRKGKIGEVEAHLEQLGRTISKLGRVDRNRVTLADGGFRDRVTIVFWIVPPGAETPKPAPWYRNDEVKLTGRFRQKRLYMFL